MSQFFEEALVARLRSLSAVAAIVGTAIYKSFIPQTRDLGADGPALTYEVLDKTRGQLLFAGDGTATASVRMTAWSYGYTTSKRLIEAIFNGIDGPPTTWGDGTCAIVSVVQHDDSDQITAPGVANDQWVYAVACDYSIRYRVTVPTLT